MVDKSKRDPNRKSTRKFNLGKSEGRSFDLNKDTHKTFDLNKDSDEQIVATAAPSVNSTEENAVVATAMAPTATDVIANEANDDKDAKAKSTQPVKPNDTLRGEDGRNGVSDKKGLANNHFNKNSEKSKADNKKHDHPKSGNQQAPVSKVDNKSPQTPVTKGNNSNNQSPVTDGGNTNNQPSIQPKTNKQKSGWGKWVAGTAVVAALFGGGYLFFNNQNQGDNPTTPPAKLAKVDVNGDGVIDINDDPTTDINGDGVIDVYDVGAGTDNVDISDKEVNAALSSSNGGGANESNDNLDSGMTDGKKGSEDNSIGGQAMDNTNPSSNSNTSPSTNETTAPESLDSKKGYSNKSVGTNPSSASPNNGNVSTASTGTTSIPVNHSANLSGSTHELALRAIRGDFGNGLDRQRMLGDSYKEIQREINRIFRKRRRSRN